MKSEFLDNAIRAENAESVATIVGVNRGEDMYKKPILASEKYAFYGSQPPEDTLKEEKAHLEAQENFRQTLIAAGQKVIASQTQDEAIAAFYGQPPKDTKKTVMPLGDPIPGYSGVNRRIQADNVFGMTYAEARKMAVESLNKVNAEKSETLRETS